MSARIIAIASFVLMLLALPAQAYDVYLVRHFEKQKASPDPALTVQGQQRAKQLADILKNAEIAKIYSTNTSRTLQTVKPYSRQSGIEVTLYKAGQLEALARQIKQQQQNVLVAGHSNTTPELIALLGGRAKILSEKDYGELFKLHIEAGQIRTSSQMVEAASKD